MGFLTDVPGFPKIFVPGFIWDTRSSLDVERTRSCVLQQMEKFVFISRKVSLKSFCRSQLPHKFVNLSFTITDITRLISLLDFLNGRFRGVAGTSPPLVEFYPFETLPDLVPQQPAALSHIMYLLIESQLPHKIVNLLITITD